MTELLVIIDFICIGRSLCKVAEKVGNSVVRPSALLDPTIEVDSELKDLKDIEIEVCTDIISLLPEILGAVCVSSIAQTLGVEVAETHVVACILSTAVEDHVSVNK